MGFLEKLRLKDWLGVRQAPTRKAILYAVDDATGEATPITAGQLGGGGGNNTGGGTAPSSPVVTATYPPQTLTVTATEASLTVPAGANRSFVTVLTGQARIGLDSATTAPIYNAGDTIEISGVELAALRLIRVGGTDATVRAEYWTGGSSTSGGSREATQLQVRDAVLALAGLLGNTDGMEALATQTNALLTTLGTYNDGVEGLLGSLGSNTDGLEGLLAALGVNDQNVIAKLEAVRLLLAGTLGISAASLPLPAGAATEAKLEAVRALLVGRGSEATLTSVLTALTGTLGVKEVAQVPGTAVADIPSGSSTGAAANLTGLGVVRVIIGTVWTAADLSFETSTDGVTWVPLYDAYGGLIVYKAAASRAINVPVGDLLRINRVRVRSGVPGAYVSQAAATGVTLVTAAL